MYGPQAQLLRHSADTNPQARTRSFCWQAYSSPITWLQYWTSGTDFSNQKKFWPQNGVLCSLWYLHMPVLDLWKYCSSSSSADEHTYVIFHQPVSFCSFAKHCLLNKNSLYEGRDTAEYIQFRYPKINLSWKFIYFILGSKDQGFSGRP